MRSHSSSLFLFLLQSILINLLIFYFINDRTDNTLIDVLRTVGLCEDTTSESEQKMLMAACLAVLGLMNFLSFKTVIMAISIREREREKEK